jgi:transposase InsO family protein
MKTDIVIDALTTVWFRRRPEPGVMHHSDRGSHAIEERLKEFGMSREGNCFDNARTGSWFNSFKKGLNSFGAQNVVARASIYRSPLCRKTQHPAGITKSPHDETKFHVNMTTFSVVVFPGSAGDQLITGLL